MKTRLAELARQASPATVEMIIPESGGGIRAHGAIASQIAQGTFNVNALRPNADSDPAGILFERDWDLIDRVGVAAAQPILVGVNDLVNAGLTFPIDDGMSVLTLSYQLQSDTDGAIATMDPRTRGRKDKAVTRRKVLPLPIVMKEWDYNIREIGAMRRSNIQIDTTPAEVANIKVAELQEDMLFNGLDDFEFDGAAIYGYCNFPAAITDSLSVAWTDSTATGPKMRRDVLGMTEKSIAAKHGGPWGLYVPPGYYTAINEDYKEATETSTIKRIKEIDGIQWVKVAQKLPADTVVLVELQNRTAQMVIGMETVTVQWNDPDGSGVHFRTMGIVVPRLRGDFEGETSGIVVFTA